MPILAAARKRHSALAYHTETGLAALSQTTSALCTRQLSRQGTVGWVYRTGLLRLLASFWGVWFVACQTWSRWGPEVHRQVLQKALTHPFSLQQSSRQQELWSLRNMCKVWLPWLLAVGRGTWAALLHTAGSGWFHPASGHSRAMQPHSGKRTWWKAATSEKEMQGTALGTTKPARKGTRAETSLLPTERPWGSRHFPAEQSICFSHNRNWWWNSLFLYWVLVFFTLSSPHLAEEERGGVTDSWPRSAHCKGESENSVCLFHHGGR